MALPPFHAQGGVAVPVMMSLLSAFAAVVVVKERKRKEDGRSKEVWSPREEGRHWALQH